MAGSSNASAGNAIVEGSAGGLPDIAKRRIPSIDGLRATAILIVMSSHAGLGWVIPGGFGVTIFFFLSGYLITTLLRIERQRTGTIHLGAFYARRAVRILPPLYLTLLLVVVLAAIGLIRVPLSIHSLGLDVIFLTNYAGVFGVKASTPIPLWSLDVEEHFYLFFPLMFLILASYKNKSLIPFLLGLCAFFLLVRVITFISLGPSDIYYWSHTRLDSIVYGSLLAVWQNPVVDKDAWRPNTLHMGGAIGIILITLAVRSPFFRETVRYSLQGIALFVLFSGAIQSKGTIAKLLNSRIMRFLALLSYTLYLIHFPLLAMTDTLPVPWSVLLAYGGSFMWATAMYLLVERPLAGWRRHSLERAVSSGKEKRSPI